VCLCALTAAFFNLSSSSLGLSLGARSPICSCSFRAEMLLIVSTSLEGPISRRACQPHHVTHTQSLTAIRYTQSHHGSQSITALNHITVVNQSSHTHSITALNHITVVNQTSHTHSINHSNQIHSITSRAKHANILCHHGAARDSHSARRHTAYCARSLQPSTAIAKTYRRIHKQEEFTNTNIKQGQGKGTRTGTKDKTTQTKTNPQGLSDDHVDGYR